MMAAWFSKRRTEDEADQQVGADEEWATESTIEVKAQVIADAARAAEQEQQMQDPAVQAEPQQAPPAATPTTAQAPGTGIAADGVVGDGDFTDEAMESADADLVVDLDRALAERKSLVQLCLYALDRARSAGVAERIEEGLAGIGVDAMRPDGDRFDPAFHEAGGTVSTEDEALDGLVAETEVVGFSDRGELLRAPIVTVYSKGAVS